MKKLFYQTAEFDKNAVKNGLSELVLQENAASKIARLVRKKLPKGAVVLALCGKGNNAADAAACVRMLHGRFKCRILKLEDDVNQNCRTQMLIARNFGVKIFESNSNLDKLFKKADCVIDGVFGSGLKGVVSEKFNEVLRLANKAKGLKVAVDVPSGLNAEGVGVGEVFKADFTVSMGALKLGLFSDFAKDFVGKVKVARLGVEEKVFTTQKEEEKSWCQAANGKENACGKITQNECDWLVELKDLELPKREAKSSHKGDFGHAFVIGGRMSGAANLCGEAALRIGAGRVSLVGVEARSLSLMQKEDLRGASCVSVGSGLGDAEVDLRLALELPAVVDADMFSRQEIWAFADSQKAVLTPHPKEFATLLGTSVEEVQARRFELAREFSRKCQATLVLKGANTIIANNGCLSVVACGTPSLAKGGSGDVLSGVILGLLAQGYSPQKAAVQGVLAHATAARKWRGKARAMRAEDLLENLAFI